MHLKGVCIRVPYRVDLRPDFIHDGTKCIRRLVFRLRHSIADVAVDTWNPQAEFLRSSKEFRTLAPGRRTSPKTSDKTVRTALRDEPSAENGMMSRSDAEQRHFGVDPEAGIAIDKDGQFLYVPTLLNVVHHVPNPEMNLRPRAVPGLG